MKNKSARINFLVMMLFFAVYCLIIFYSKYLILNSFIILILSFIMSYFWARSKSIQQMEKFTLKVYIKEIPWIVVFAAMMIVFMLSVNGIVSNTVCMWAAIIPSFFMNIFRPLKRRNKTAQYGELQSPQSHHEESE